MILFSSKHAFPNSYVEVCGYSVKLNNNIRSYKKVNKVLIKLMINFDYHVYLIIT